nr:DUF4433 domain-containing protein [Thermogemmata fonticola]
MPRNRVEIKSLYYITHLDNVSSILEKGILSHSRVATEGVPFTPIFTPIYDASIVSNRQHRMTPDGRSLWEYANLYFQPRNPMMYRVVYEKGADYLAVLGVKPKSSTCPTSG